MATYEIYLSDDSGRRITLLKNVAFFSISRAINGYGTCHIGIPFQGFKVYPAFLLDRRIELWRSPTRGATLRREGSYFLRKYNVYTRDEDNVQIIEFYGRSPLDILRRQAVTSTTLAKYQKTDFIDDMMKEIVSENFISPQQTAPAGELTVDGEESIGPSVSHTFFSQNVLDVLKDLRDISISLNESDNSNTRIYFDVIEGSPLSNGGFGYTFRTYANLRGTDRTAGKVFSVENGNIKAPSYYEDHLDSFTVAKMLNLSTPAANGEATSPESTLSRWNTIVSAQQSSETTSALNDSKANSVLQDGKSDISFNPTILDSPGSDRQPRSLYGVDWDLGDLLPVRYAGKNFNSEVTTVYLSVDEDGKENIVGLTSLRQVIPSEAEPPPVTCVDDFAPYTVALLHMDGSDGSTTFTDESAKTWTANGNAQIDTAQSVFGGASGFFDGSGDYVTTVDSDDFTMGSGDFTVDARVRPAVINQNGWYVIAQASASGADTSISFFIRLNADESFSSGVVSGGTYYVATSSAGAYAANTWYHVAMVRNGNTITQYINGTQNGTVNVTGVSINNSTSNLSIGRLGEYSSSFYFNGWVDELRISKGIARWTANFTPPTLPYCDP